MGAGLLVGTALAVIIPEGVDTMYSSQQGTVRGTPHLSISTRSLRCHNKIGVVDLAAQKRNFSI